jgi:hypothetical protein
MNLSPFSCPIFLGHSEARGRCSQGERVLYGRDLWCLGGAGKAEPAKLPGAGIGPSCAEENVWQKKGNLPKSVRISTDERTTGKSQGQRTGSMNV